METPLAGTNDIAPSGTTAGFGSGVSGWHGATDRIATDRMVLANTLPPT